MPPSTQTTPGLGLEATTTRDLVTLTPSASPTPPINFHPDEQSSQIGYLFPLSIQHLTRSSVTIHFELAQPSIGYFVLWPETEGLSNAFLFAFDQATIDQNFVVDGLQPGIRYRIDVAIPGDDGVYRSPNYRSLPWGPIAFTLPEGDNFPLRVAVIGDSGYGESTTLDLAALMASYQPDFMLHTGDLVYLAENNLDPVDAYAEKFFQQFESILRQAPIYPVVGNHEHYWDVVFRDSYAYYYAFPRFPSGSGVISGDPSTREWYAFAYGDIQFILLNTQSFFGYPGRPEQLAWLEDRLTDPAYAYSIVVLHVPPYTAGAHPNDGAAVRSDWVPLFEANNVPLVLSGHDHNYQRQDVSGITYIISGGGSGVLYDQNSSPEYSRIFSKQMHFVMLEIYPDRIELQAIGLDGTVFDQVVLPID
jgi:acid phosphatase